ncbi:MAG TPA: CotH kinase family protein [Saprospiraceae bacterium]|nr:CotH kinase family protein [Saprospiraceae bacterium]HMO41446.1 CotH kinase family protein [Saprospiraceae bacterium]HMP23545.1 CotH kinase family protein [Saprospiraceae bacterium]
MTREKTTLTALLLLFGLCTWAQQEAIAPPIECYPQGGFYAQEIEVQLLAPGATAIHYTLDGSTPTRRAAAYKRPIRLRTTAVLRAVAYYKGQPARSIAHTYFINEPATNFPVVSIGITPAVLFDSERGMFMQGNQLIDNSWKQPGANFWTRQEVPAHIEIFESNGQNVYNSLSGLRLFGGMSRLFPQKSMTIVARPRYGQKRIKHPIFGDQGLKEFKFLVLRNSGSDWGRSYFRDALMARLVNDLDIDKQDYRPAHVYINGKYWGIYNIREKINRYFIAAHNEGVDKDSLDYIEHYLIRRRGSTRHYRQMLEFIAENNLRDPVHYAYIQTLMDVDNFMNYQIAQIYFDNQDAGGNIKYWRPHSRDGRWRWILFDTDWGFGLHDSRAYRNNSLAFHTEPNGPAWPNPPWSTFLLRSLLENPDFERAFVTRFADHLNTIFEPERVKQHIEAMYQHLLPEMPRHLKRWRLNEQEWHAQVQVLRNFADERPYHTRLHLMDRFETGGLRHLQLSVEGGGAVLLNKHLEINSEQPFAGVYFEKIPVSLKVVPRNGYRFVGWEGIASSGAPEDNREISLLLTEKDMTVKAIFEKYEHPLAGKVVINEISANNREAGDWIEIFNHSKEKVNLRGWILADLKNEFVFPNVDIAPNDYLVVCQDMRRFYQSFPNAYNVVGELPFGLNKRRERLELFASFGAMVDSLAYELPPTDSVFTLSLLLPHLDNSDPTNWEIRYGTGTPNAPNPYFLESRIRRTQREWLEVGMALGIVILCLALLVLRHRRIL